MSSERGASTALRCSPQPSVAIFNLVFLVLGCGQCQTGSLLIQSSLRLSCPLLTNSQGLFLFVRINFYMYQLSHPASSNKIFGKGKLSRDGVGSLVNSKLVAMDISLQDQWGQDRYVCHLLTCPPRYSLMQQLQLSQLHFVLSNWNRPC